MAEIAGAGRGRPRSHGAPAEVPRPVRRLASGPAITPTRKRIFTAYANGVNAFIAQNKDRLPIEFVVTGIVPEPWTIEQLVLRARRRSATPATELQLARNVARLGAAEANRARNPDPPDALVVPDGLDVAAITDEVVASGARAAVAARRRPRCCRNTVRQPRRRRGDDTSVREPGQQQLGRRRRHARRPAIPSSPTIRIAKCRTRRCATSSTCRRPAGTSSAPASRRLSASRSATTSASRGA